MIKNIIIFLAIILVFGLVYLLIDSKLYYYGVSRYNICQRSLSLGLEPDYWDTHVCYPEIGLTINNKSGFVMIAKDVTYLYNNETIKTKKIIKYGFNTERLIALVEAEDNYQYYIVCVKNSDPLSKRDLQINVFDSNMVFNSSDFKWIDYENDLNRVSTLKKARAYTVLFFIVLILIVGFGSIRFRKALEE